MNKTFTIVYTCYNIKSEPFKDGKIHVKNKYSEFDAKCSLENYLKKKHPELVRLVITSCVPKNAINDLLGGSDIFGTDFGSIFGGMNKPKK